MSMGGNIVKVSLVLGLTLAAGAAIAQNSDRDSKPLLGVYRTNTMPGGRFMNMDSASPGTPTTRTPTLTREGSPIARTEPRLNSERPTGVPTNGLLVDGNIARVKNKRPAPVVATERTITRDGDTTSVEERFVKADGRVIERDSTIVRDGDTTTRTSETRTGDGRVLSAASETVTRDGQSLSRVTQTTTPNGGTISREVNVTRDGNTVTRTETTTAPAGSTAAPINGWSRSTRACEPVAAPRAIEEQTFERRADERLRTDTTNPPRINGWGRVSGAPGERGGRGPSR